MLDLGAFCHSFLGQLSRRDQRVKRTVRLSDAPVLRHPAVECSAKLRGDDSQRQNLQARFKRMARHDQEGFLNEVASEAEVDACTGKIGSVFQAVRIITGNDISSNSDPSKHI